jgi:hypothetical protein
MTKPQFLVLSLLLGVQILIGYGMLFVLQQPDENPLLAGNHTSPPQSSKAGLGGENQEPIHIPEVEAKEESTEVLPEEIVAEPEPFNSIQDKPVVPIELRNTALTPQGQLANPPEIVNAVYLTSWSGGSATRIDYVINLASSTDINAVVMDIKDFSGEIAYDTAVPEVDLYKGENIKIRNIESTIRKLHDAGIYVIARVTVFQDPILANARPDLAVQSSSTKEVWKDYKGLSWIDPSAKEAWNYNAAIARDAASRGFDEINFDYIRFPSDGDLKDMIFPRSDGTKIRAEVMEEFFAYLKANLQDVKISADLFGLATSSRDDLGIGQVIETAYKHFDYVYPMVYASHYAQGYNGYANPAQHPYEVVRFSMQTAQARLDALQQANPGQKFAKLRPWLQDFDLGADYDTLMVQAQIQATKDALGQNFTGYLMWAPTNWYTAEALHPFVFDQLTYNARTP